MLVMLLFAQYFASAQQTFDSSFGENGISILGNSETVDVQFQEEDKIISISQNFLSTKVTLNRLNLDGSLDETFGNNGVFESYGHVQGSWNIVLDSEKNIYFASCNEDTIKVTKVKQHGSLDESFGNNGHAELVTSNIAQNLYISRIAIDNNGKLIASGEYKDLETLKERIIVACFNQDGSIDNNFGENGLYLNPEIPNQSNQRNIGRTIINPDNSIVVSGYVYYSNDEIGFLAVKLNPDGTLDNTFAENGMYKAILEGYSSFRGSILMDDNSIIFCGDETNSSGHNGMVTKIFANGELDTSFGNDGYAECFNGGSDTIVMYYDAILKNNEIIVIGDILDETPFTRSTIITKLNLDGTVVDYYGENGSMIFESSSVERPSLRAFAFTEKDDEYYCAGELSSNGDYNILGSIFKIINQDINVNSIDKTNLTIFPNPTSDFVYINSESLIESVSIYNSLGQIIFEISKPANNQMIRTSQLKKGIYLVKAKVNGKYTSKKLLIE
jgi:uncharacterized delta-60 repeat protein